MTLDNDMTIQKAAIERAIKGGWAVDLGVRSTCLKCDKRLCGCQFRWEERSWKDFALDPSFWQALDKGLGERGYIWDDRARVFYDLILTGGDTDKFWADQLV